jgi:hypothetical protein
MIGTLTKPTDESVLKVKLLVCHILLNICIMFVNLAIDYNGRVSTLNVRPNVQYCE